MPQSNLLDVIELADIVALASNPIQGVLALLRWQKQYCPHDNTHSTSSTVHIQGMISKNRSLLRKLSHYATSVSLMERTLLLEELPRWLVTLLELPKDCTKVTKSSHKRDSGAISLGLNGGNEYTQSSKRHCLESNSPEKCSVIALDDEQNLEKFDQKKNGVVFSPSRNVLDSSFLSYSESSVWKTQQNFYEKRGAGVWERGEVPSQISSNAFVANQYVTIILKFIERNLSELEKQPSQAGKQTYKSCEDVTSIRNFAGLPVQVGSCVARPDCRRKCRVAVVEIGAGHGLLSFLMARRFQEILQKSTASSSSSVPQDMRGYINQDMSQLSVDVDIDVTVIATDFHSGVFDELLLLPWIRKLCETGMLDFAVCAAMGAQKEFDPCPKGDDTLKKDDPGPRGDDTIKCPKRNYTLKGDKTPGDKILRLMHSGRSSDEHEWDLLVIVANYAFDSFPTDFIACVRDTSGKAEHRLYEIGVGLKYSQKLHIEKVKSVQHSYERKSEKKGLQSNRRKHRERLKEAFPVTSRCPRREILMDSKIDATGMTVEPVIMIVGDCVVAEDSQLWQTQKFEQLAFSRERGPVPIPWFDPPLISPQPSVCAVPISVKAMDLVFAEVFGRDNDGHRLHSHKAQKEKEKHSPRPGNLCSSTPQCGSSFSVLVYSNTNFGPSQARHRVDDMFESTGMDDERKAMLYDTPTLPHFGPHDYSALRELFLSNSPRRKVEMNEPVEGFDALDGNRESVVKIGSSFPIYATKLSLDFLWRFIMEVGCVDTLLFIELRWMLLHKILNFVSTIVSSCHMNRLVDLQCSSVQPTDSECIAVTEVERWCDAALTCTRQHTCCSPAALMLLRENIAQWLMALSSSLRSLFVTGSTSSLLRKGSSGPDSCTLRTLQGASMYALNLCLSLYSHQLVVADGMSLNNNSILSFPLQQNIAQLIALPRDLTGLHVPHEGENEASSGYKTECQSEVPEKVIADSNPLSSLYCLSGLECATCAFALLAMYRTSWPLVHGDGTPLRMLFLVLPTLGAIADAVRNSLLKSCDKRYRGEMRAQCRLRRLSRKLDGMLAMTVC